MALLAGSLEAFRVQELLGLVAHKPGQWLLVMRGPEHAGFVGVRDGRVVCASADDSRQDLARRFVVAGVVGTTSLAEAARHAADSGSGLARALVERDCVDPQVLPSLVRAHMVGALADLTHLRSGDFSADVVEELPDDVGVSFPLAELGPEITGLLHKWRPASDLLGGLNSVIASHPGQVPARLQGVYSLIDGHRTVSDLIEASGHGRVGTIVDLAELVNAGCAHPVVGDTGAVEQRLAMLSALETPGPATEQPQGPHLAVIKGGVEDADETVAATEEPAAEDLLSILLRGVRGV